MNVFNDDALFIAWISIIQKPKGDSLVSCGWKRIEIN
jgi:hypothetical protein